MNELEKQTPGMEATEEVASTACEKTQENATVETVTASEAAAEAPCTTEVNEEQPAWKRYHEMSKDELLAELTEIVESGKMDHNKEVAAIKQAYHALRSKEIEQELNEYLEKNGDPTGFATTPDSSEEAFKQLMTRFKDGRTAFLAEQEAVRKSNLEKKQAVIDQIKSIIEDIDNINLHFPRFSELQNEFKEIKDIPETAETAIWKEYQALVEKFYDHLKVNKELRDLDFKKNLEAKRALIDEAKALKDVKDLVVASRRLQELHNTWREIGPVAKEFRESIWEEFREASTVIRKAHQEYFEARKAQEAENEAAKVTLCEEVEAVDYASLTNFAAWDEMTKNIIALQGRWKELGYASRKVNSELYARFRQACDAFFNAKADYYKRVKDEMNENLAKKLALCEKAEALKDAENKGKAAEEIRALQAEWKTIGTVPRRQSDAVWQRFNGACNEFFKDRQRRVSAVREEENANMAAKLEVIESLKAIDPEKTGRSEGLPLVRELQQKWQSIGHVPFKKKDELYASYRAECDRLYDAFDASGKKGRINSFRNKVDKMDNSDNGLNRERERLYRAYEQKRAELKTYENNLGFFKYQSASENPLLKDIERKVARIKEDLTELKKKIEMIDEKL